MGSSHKEDAKRSRPKLIMNKQLYDMLKSDAEADKAKALLTFELISNHSAGIGDHSTSDFYSNATDALKMLASADERLDTLAKYFTRSGGCIDNPQKDLGYESLSQSMERDMPGKGPRGEELLVRPTAP